MKSKTIVEKGRFKKEISTALYKNKDIQKLLLGDTSKMSTAELRKAFKEHVKSHLFIDDTIKETSSFIFYDVYFPNLYSNTKECRVVMYIIAHRDILDNFYQEGYEGDRVDALSQMVENTLINDEEISNSFGIGRLNLDSINIYNATKFYGCIMNFSVHNFR